MHPTSTDMAPAAIGPYSQAIVSGGFLFVSGQLPLDPISGMFNSQNSAEQIGQCLRNIAAIAVASGTSIARTVKTTIFVTNLADFPAINAVYSEAFLEPYPARSTIEVKGLPKGALVEVEAIISMPEGS